MKSIAVNGDQRFDFLLLAFGFGLPSMEARKERPSIKGLDTCLLLLEL